MIANAMGLAMEGKRWRKHPRGMNEMSLWNFFVLMKVLYACMVDLGEKRH